MQLSEFQTAWDVKSSSTSFKPTASHSRQPIPAHEDKQPVSDQQQTQYFRFLGHKAVYSGIQLT